MTSVCNPVGSIFVEPDATLQSLRPLPNTEHLKNSACVMARFVDKNNNPHSLCPRAQLGVLATKFEHSYGLEFLVGFEVEITFCKIPLFREDHDAKYQPLDSCHAWGTFTDEQYVKSFDLMLRITAQLKYNGIEIQQLHSEAGAGQYEFVLPPLSPVAAVDALIQTRQCIQQMAAAAGLRATCHPQPFPGIGTAAHAHISFNRSSSASPDVEIDDLQMSFMASVIEHIPALCAITMPQEVSYARVVDDSWTGGTWVAWGTENREVPLRKSGPLMWEVRCLDGFANMYLALTAILSAGFDGLRKGKKMIMKDCHSTSDSDLPYLNVS
jgi:glutamine synthetase